MTLHPWSARGGLPSRVAAFGTLDRSHPNTTVHTDEFAPSAWSALVEMIDMGLCGWKAAK
jgi:hypothetical protein